MASTEDSAAATPAPPPLPPHIVMVPYVSPGHTIPMVDLSRLLAAHGARVSVVTTPVNCTRLRGVAEQAAGAKLPLELVELPFPTGVDGLPPGIENFDQVTDDNGYSTPLFAALQELAGPLEVYLRSLARPPSCIVSDWCSPWPAGVARSLGIPRLVFHVQSCFFSLWFISRVLAAAACGDEQKILAVPVAEVDAEVSKKAATPPAFLKAHEMQEFWGECVQAMLTADGAVVNTFLDLEGETVARYEAALGKPVWALGPFCLSNRDAGAMASRGNDYSTDEQGAVTAWLDGKGTDSVVLVSFGSLLRMAPAQLIEVGHGLEDSGAPFIWVVKESEAAAAAAEVPGWLEALEARTAGRGLVVRGWAPQLAVLAHRATGGFVTHCGWNSLQESVLHGVPVVTWPHFSDQFVEERLVVDVLRVGVPVCGGATSRREDAPVAREDIARAVAAVVGGGEEVEQRRSRAKEYAKKARAAMEKGGSSYEKLTQLMESFGQNGGK